MFKFIVAISLLVAMTAGANAGCGFGEKNLPGSLGSGQKDTSRSFTVNDSARFIVQVRTGGPISANLGCGWRTGMRHSCRVFGWGDTRVVLRNNTEQQITYRWICRH